MYFYIYLLANLCTCHALYDGHLDKSTIQIDEYKGLPEIVGNLAGKNPQHFPIMINVGSI